MEDKAGGTRRVRYRVLGPVTVQGPGGPYRLGAPKQRAVLAVLLLHANRVVTERRLYALVWGEKLPRSVRGRLQVYISELRALLGDEVIVRVGQGYRIDVAPGELDLDVFAELVAKAQSDQESKTAGTVARQLRSALALWSGPPLVGVSEALIEHERRGLEERRLAALEALFEVELAAGRHGEIIDELRRATAAYPLEERLATQLMLALDQGERREEALRIYSEIRRRLVDELGVEPGQRLRAVQARVLSGGDTVSQVAADAGRGTRRSVSTGFVRPAELPRDMQRFVGRRDALAALDAQLAVSDSAVCVISGSAGVGKTSLAVHWAHSVRDRFPDGQLYLDLRGYELDEQPLASSGALNRLLRSLGVDPRRESAPLAERVELYRSMLAGRRILVILDNAQESSQVMPLLPSSGMTVVTSRNRLSDVMATVGAGAVSLGTLTDREALELMETVIGHSRVGAERASATELTGLCGGLPLALRLVAAQLAAVPQARIAKVAAELAQGDPFAVFAADGSEHSVVRAAFSASYRALDPAGQRLFRLLGLVPGPDFTASTVAALAALSPDDALRGLDALSEAHVIERAVAGRFRFHELLRLYAVEQVRNDPERTAAWNRLVRHYLDITTALTERYREGGLALPRALPREPDQAGQPNSKHSTLTALDVEIPNVAAAVTLAARQGPYPDAWLVADGLRTYFHRNGRRAEWSDIAREILTEADRRDEHDVRAMLHYSIGDCRFMAGQLGEGVYHLTKSVEIAGNCGWHECEASGLAALGVTLAWTGQLREATKYTQKAAALFSEIGSIVGENRTLKSLGIQHYLAGNLRVAEDCHLQALDLSTRHGLRLAQAADLAHLDLYGYCSVAPTPPNTT